MKKKNNNKGFTLIELLATIVILALITTVTVVTILGAIEKSQEKAEEAFVKQIENYIDEYIAVEGSRLDYKEVILTDDNKKKKCHKGTEGNSICSIVDLYKATSSENINKNMNIEYISDEYSDSGIVNPKTKEECNASNTTLTIYRDSDFVYCFEFKKSGTGVSCITESQTINTCKKLYENW